MTGVAEEELSDLVEETKEYYRQRAGQYSDWARRTGAYEGGEEPDDSWFDEAGMVLDALERAAPAGDVLEIACGTGIWTERVAKSAASVTAVDSSPEMIERNRERLGSSPKVKYVLADFYEWTPDARFDWVTFSFWISHVPRAKLDGFAEKVATLLKPGGRIFFVDQKVEAMKHEALEGPGSEVVTRLLNDGKRFRVVKHFYAPDDIRKCFERVGIRVELRETPTQFFYVAGVLER